MFKLLGVKLKQKMHMKRVKEQLSVLETEKEKQGWISNWNPSTKKNMAYIGPETWPYGNPLRVYVHNDPKMAA